MPGKYRTYLEQRYASDKETLEVIQLFARRQTGGALWLGIGAGFIGFVASQTGTTTTSSGTTTVKVTPLGYGLMVGLFGGVGIGKLSRFGNQKLYEVLLSNDKQRGWPEYVAKRL